MHKLSIGYNVSRFTLSAALFSNFRTVSTAHRAKIEDIKTLQSAQQTEVIWWVFVNSTCCSKYFQIGREPLVNDSEM